MPHSPMIKLAQDVEEEAERAPSWNCLTFTSWGIFLIYKAQFTNLLLILGIKSLNFRDKISFSYHGLIFREIRDLETGKFVDKYLFCVFSAFIRLSLTNFPYAISWPVGGLEILDRPP